MRVLVLGDRIIDQYTYCKATRLSPEAPVPVLVPTKEATSEGGASLVFDQLKQLLGDDVSGIFGSMSMKHRIFADRQMVARIDRDQTSLPEPSKYWNKILMEIKSEKPTAVVVGDYGKGALPDSIASGVTAACIQEGIPLFVDAKHRVEPYRGCYAIFPNELEHNGISPDAFQNIVRKLGAKGCSVNGRLIATEEQQVFDVTGAGDIFMAAFVASFCRQSRTNGVDLMACAQFANKVAGISVRHIGTYVVKPQEIDW